MDITLRCFAPAPLWSKLGTMYAIDLVMLSPISLVLLVVYYVMHCCTSLIFTINVLFMHIMATLAFTSIKLLSTRQAQWSVAAKMFGSLSSFLLIPIAFKVGHPEHLCAHILDSMEALYQQHEGAVCIALLIACAGTAYGVFHHVRSYLSSTPFPSPTVIRKYNKNYWY